MKQSNNLTVDEMQEIANKKSFLDTENKIKEYIKSNGKQSFTNLVNEINEPKEKVENAIRCLLQRQEIGETANWEFYLSKTVNSNSK